MVSMIDGDGDIDDRLVITAIARNDNCNLTMLTIVTKG